MKNKNFKVVVVAMLAIALVIGAALAGSTPKVQTAKVLVTEEGYQPASVTLRKGIPARITFLRKTDATCGTEILLPAYKIKKTLPLNKPVVVQFTPKKTGTIAFTCGMKMMKGKIVVK